MSGGVNLWGDEAQVMEIDLSEAQEAKAEKRRLWKEKHLAKFSASEYHRLTTGLNETKEEAVVRFSRMLKADLLKLLEDNNLQPAEKMTNKELAEMLMDWDVLKWGENHWPEGAETYVMEKVVEELTGLSATEEFTTAAIAHGNEYELEAGQHLSKSLGIEIERMGEDQEFIDMHHPDFDQTLPEDIKAHIGGTPDGKLVIKEGAGAETKCPKSTTHLKYLLNLRKENLKEQYPELYWQITGIMLLTGWASDYAESYDPRFKNERLRALIIKIDRNEGDIQRLITRLKMAVRRKNEILEQLNQQYLGE